MARRQWSRAKKGTLSAHKKEAWTEFSLYIRLRDSLILHGSAIVGYCVTCGAEKPTVGSKNSPGLQAGHFIAGRGNSLLFDERNCHSQCYSCNMGKSGNQAEYFIFMERNYGREVIEELRRLRHVAVKYTKAELDDIRDMYAAKREALLTGMELPKWELPVNLDHDLPF